MAIINILKIVFFFFSNKKLKVIHQLKVMLLVVYLLKRKLT